MTDPTGEAALADVERRLDALEEVPVGQHPAVLEAVHDDIAAALEGLSAPHAGSPARPGGEPAHRP